jgi:glutathione reductase (NADPH)
MEDMRYNLLVIGSGSGGMATARRAAFHATRLGQKLKIGVIERDAENLLGGTCVSRGCVPKKVMWSAANIADLYHHVAEHYGFVGESRPKIDFAKLVRNRETYTARLRKIYEKNLNDSGIDLIKGFAKWVHASNGLPQVDVGSNRYTADHLVIACGGKSVVPENLIGAEHCIDSDGFFRLTQLPKSVVVVGAGYIAVELAGVLNALGSETTICVRGDRPIRNFDSMLSEELMTQMKQNGVVFETGFTAARVTVDESTGIRTVESEDKSRQIQGDCIILATGRSSREYLEAMNVPENMCADGLHHILVDEFQNTRIPRVYAVGDVIGKAELTPVAIAAGRRLSDRLFGV